MNSLNIRYIYNPFVFFLFLLFSSCLETNSDNSDIYNSKAYAYHYSNLDSTNYYAMLVYDNELADDDAKAEALNNLAFVNISRMEYEKAWQQLGLISEITDNQIELLIMDVQYMRLCQRMSRNKEFYDYRHSADARLKRIKEEYHWLSERQRRRMVYAESEFSIVTSTYYFYVGLNKQSVEALHEIDEEELLLNDTVQYLNYLYYIGSGGVLNEGTEHNIIQQEFEFLMKCYAMAKSSMVVFYEANALGAIANLLTRNHICEKLVADNPSSLQYLFVKDCAKDSLAVKLAKRSLELFVEFGDVYQIAGANRTLSSCYMAIGDYYSALNHLNTALEDKRISQAPDLEASIREQLSVAYAAINDKHSSDFNRNLYLDLQEDTRQDKYLEARAEMLNDILSQLNMIVFSVLLIIVCLLILLWYLYKRNNKIKQTYTLNILQQPLNDWLVMRKCKLSEYADNLEYLEEKQRLIKNRIFNSHIRLAEQRTKMSLVNEMTPLIDRTINEINKLSSRIEDTIIVNERIGYIHDLLDKIIEYNNVLTHWIEIRKGEVGINVESFKLQEIFDIIAKSKTGFAMKDIAFSVDSTNAIVKADKVLTLFMINTLAENARKFTDRGGEVRIFSSVCDDYVEISVQDSGIGISEQQLDAILSNNIYDGHGYGILNCNGIINKYRKLSSIFKVCLLSAESKLGNGSRFFFRLPKGLLRGMLVIFFSLSALSSYSSEKSDNLSIANIFADSLYISNVRGDYEMSFAYADSCISYLNRHYLETINESKQTMKLFDDSDGEFAEIEWFRDSVPTDYQIILDVRNECAVAALSMHNWEMYNYNNDIYIRLYNEMSADNTLEDYCRMMQQSQTNNNIAIVVLITILLLILPLYYFLYYRKFIYHRMCVEKLMHMNGILMDDSDIDNKLNVALSLERFNFSADMKELAESIRVVLENCKREDRDYNDTLSSLDDECRKLEFEYNNIYTSCSILENCLSSLKHETMYYPSRVSVLLGNGSDNMSDVKELISFYRDIHYALSANAMKVMQSAKSAVSKFIIKGKVVVGNKELLEILFDILKKHTKCCESDIVCDYADDGYVRFLIPVDENIITDFTANNDNFNLMICRQIVRDHSELTNKRRCGIGVEYIEARKYITVMLASSR